MTDDMAERIAALEQEIRALRARVAALERLSGSSVPEHPADQRVVQRKVVYDWQA